MIVCPFCDNALQPLSQVPGFLECITHKVVMNGSYRTANYEEDYFNKEYASQYGKEYLADGLSIQIRNSIRYTHISRYMNANTHNRVLEIGSAAGFFLSFMREKGFDVTGYEISLSMSQYANKKGIPTFQGSFMSILQENPQLFRTPFDAVTAFYVLEHFEDQSSAWKNFSALTRKGGYLILALPSYDGPMFHFHSAEWAKTHPTDHAIDYSPHALRLVAQDFGFHLQTVKSEGIHPMRFPLGNLFPLRQAYGFFQEIFPFSDTIFAILERQ